MKAPKLNDAQRALVEEHLDIIKWAIEDHVIVRENIPGLEFYDLFQEGCILLMKASQSYSSTKGAFQSFARVVVRNGLRSYCKAVCAKDKNRIYPGSSSDEDEGYPDVFMGVAALDDTGREVEDGEFIAMLESFLPEYSGVTKKGIEAIILKVKGYAGVDIAARYGTDQYNVAAWISRAKKKLSSNERFASFLQAFV